MECAHCGRVLGTAARPAPATPSQLLSLGWKELCALVVLAGATFALLYHLMPLDRYCPLLLFPLTAMTLGAVAAAGAATRPETRWRRLARVAQIMVIYLLVYGTLVMLGHAAVGIGMMYDSALTHECASKLQAMGQATRMYLADHDQRFPVGATWCDALAPYVGSERMPDPAREYYLVHSIPVEGGPPREGFGYALSGGVAAARYTDLDASYEPGVAVALFESDLGWNACGGPELLPRQPRHFGGENFAFADGHTEWVRRSRASALGWRVLVRSDSQEGP